MQGSGTRAELVRLLAILQRDPVRSRIERNEAKEGRLASVLWTNQQRFRRNINFV